MALGLLNAWKVWKYGEDDSDATFSAKLNRLVDSVTNALQNAGRPICTSQADRDARFPAPTKGNTCYRSDLDQTQRYDGAAWVTWGGVAAIAQGANLTVVAGSKISRREDHVIGTVRLTATAAIAGGATLLTLPAGFRPVLDARNNYRNEGTGTEAQAYVTAAGVVSVGAAIASGASVTLNLGFVAA